MAWTHTRAAIAALHHSARVRGEEPDPVRLADLQRKLKAERARLYLCSLNAEPRLDAGQLVELAGLLLTGAGGGNAAA